MPKKVILILLGVALILVIGGSLYYLTYAPPVTMKSTGPEKADELLKAYRKHAGAGNDVTSDDLPLQYNSERDVLTMRVYVTMARTKNAPEDRLAAYQRMQEALNNPKIGGMFDMGGGKIILDKDRQAWFLVKEYPVASTDKEELLKDAEKLSELAAVWTTTWFFDVAMIMHGNKEAPLKQITISNKTY